MWKPHIVAIAAALADGVANLQSADAFLDWVAGAPSSETESQSHAGNVYQYPGIDSKVRIKIGSIHSVKGETHTATLILETFFHRHHLLRLKPWLLGAKTGQGLESATSRIGSSLRQHYVAMTRPSRLLCAAMRVGDLGAAEITNLRSRGWRVARIDASDMVWL